MWRLNEYPVTEKSHTVIRLDVHLENMQNVTFREGSDIDAVLDRNHATKRTDWFELNERDAEARQYLYTEIPKHYTYKPSSKRRTKCVSLSAKANVISRMYSVSPRDRERFYLRMLLLHVRGARSFTDMRTYNGVRYDTFESVCKERGLLSDDREWHRTLEDASATAMPREMRSLFVTILGMCEPNYPKELWEEFSERMSEDIARTHDLSLRLARQYALKEINGSLMANYKMSVEMFGITELIDDLPDLDNGPTIYNRSAGRSYFVQLEL